MKLELCRNIFPDDITDIEFFKYMQKGYEYIIKKLRLYPSVHPIIIQGYTAKLNEFYQPAHIAFTNSEIGFKKIRLLMFANLINLPTNENRTGNIIVGKFYEPHQALPIELYDASIEQPNIFIGGDEIISEQENPIFALVVDAYPYPILHEQLNEYQTEYRYNFEWMVNTYGEENLYMDFVVGVFTLLQALSFYNAEMNNVYAENMYNKLCVDLLNIHNQNFAAVQDSYNEHGILINELG